MPPRQKISDEALKRLAQYWTRAALMRDLMHGVIDKHGGIQEVIDANADWEIEAYLAYWLVGLFVVVEGFNKLKLKDARVQKLFHAHLNDLKEFRHETYHFTLSRVKGGKAVRAVNWAEELHEATRQFIGEQISEKTRLERLREFRAKKKGPQVVRARRRKEPEE